MSNPWINTLPLGSPFEANTLVDIRYKNGEEQRCVMSKSLYWTHSKDNGECIVAYRAHVLDHNKPVVKQERYLTTNGSDTIDKWAERLSPEMFREIIWCQMEKYKDRLGKKDDIAKEVRKIADYANRWALVEEAKTPNRRKDNKTVSTS